MIWVGRFLDDESGPQLGQQPVLLQQLARVPDEEQERVEDLGLDRQRRRSALRIQQTSTRVEPEVPELI
jgi:hypothetical protein